MVATALAVTLIGNMSSVITLQFVGYWGCWVGIGLLFYGKRMRHLAFPFFMLLFIIPMPNYVNKMLTFKMRLIASSLSAELLRAVGVSVFLEGNILDLGLMKLHVVDACSGLRSLVAMTVMSVVIGYFFLRRWWSKALLVIAVLPLAIFANALRVFATGYLKVNGYEKMAEGIVHDATGVIIFAVSGGILTGLSFLLRKVEPKLEKPAGLDPGHYFTGFSRPMALTLSLILMFATSACAMNRMETKFIVPERKAFAEFPLEINEFRGKRLSLSKSVLKYLSLDDYLNAVYSDRASDQKIYVFIPYYRTQKPYHSVHAPLSCLLGSGWELVGSRRRQVSVSQGGPINVMMMTMKKEDKRLLALYFYFQRGRIYTSPWANKLYLMWDALTRRRTDGALVRVETPMARGQSDEEAFRVLENFINDLWLDLTEYVPT